jgi:hypothetical protein
VTAVFCVQLLASPPEPAVRRGFRRSQPGKNLPVLVGRDTKAQKGFVDPMVSAHRAFTTSGRSTFTGDCEAADRLASQVQVRARPQNRDC